MFPDLSNLDRFVVGFTLTFFRVAGLMLFAPLFGSARVPRRVKLLLALVLTIPIVAVIGVPHIPMPDSVAQLAAGLACEIAFGFALGMVVSLTFIAAQWAGEMVGQQIGLSMAEVLDPSLGGSSSLVGELYFMLSTAVFLILGGHRMMIVGLAESMRSFPPLSITVDFHVLDVVVAFLTAATQLALRLSAPLFVTMIVVDVSLGCISKTIPQLNVMSAGMALRGVLGILVLAIGLSVAVSVISGRLQESLVSLTNLLHPAP